MFKLVTQELTESEIDVRGHWNEAAIACGTRGPLDDQGTIGRRTIEKQPPRVAFASVVEHFGERGGRRLREDGRRRISRSAILELVHAHRCTRGQIPRLRLRVRVVTVVKQSSHARVYARRTSSSIPE